MPELVVDGRDGFVVGNLDGAVEAVAGVDRLDRAGIRHAAAARFGVARMVDEYAALYEQILASVSAR